MPRLASRWHLAEAPEYHVVVERLDGSTFIIESRKRRKDAEARQQVYAAGLEDIREVRVESEEG